MIELQSHSSSKSEKSSIIDDFGVTLRKDRIRKNVEKKKEKNLDSHDQNSSEGKGHLSKEQKLRRQKIKNRESAQRSRDQRKFYITKLEQQNSQLRADRDRVLKELDNLSQSKLCVRCQGALVDNTCSFEHSLSDEFQSSMMGAGTSPDDASYERIVGESNNKLPLFLFVCFVMVGVFMFGNGESPNNVCQAVPEMLFDVEHMSKALVPAYPNPLQDSCLAQYLTIRDPDSDKLSLPGNLRAPSQKRKSNDVLVCRSPELMKYNISQNIFSNQLEIIMKGRELNISGNMMKEIDAPTQNIKNDDLYMLLVQVKGISRYTGLKCLA